MKSSSFSFATRAPHPSSLYVFRFRRCFRYFFLNLLALWILILFSHMTEWRTGGRKYEGKKGGGGGVTTELAPRTTQVINETTSYA